MNVKISYEKKLKLKGCKDQFTISSRQYPCGTKSLLHREVVIINAGEMPGCLNPSCLFDPKIKF